MNPVTVVGGGFSGLVTSYYLAKNGVPVRLLEKQNRLGGLIGTLQTSQGPVELAASGIRSSARLEELCADLDLPLLETKKESRARYLYRGGPRRWPLGPIDSLELGGRLAGNLLIGRVRPRTDETIDHWASRVLGKSASRYIVGAALQGIYAGDPKQLSASLIFGKKAKPAKGRLEGLVAPELGMSQLVDALERKLLSLGVVIEKGVSADTSLRGPVVICTAAKDASGLLRARSPEVASILGRIEMLPLIRVTAFYPAAENTIGGFGVLFPRAQGVKALGVLFNTNIFANRGEGHSESWIYGGGEDRDVMDLGDAALFELVARDRRKLYGRNAEPSGIYPQRWPLALPHYDVKLEGMLRSGIVPPPDTFLAGNYLRGIGLPLLLEKGWDVAQQVRKHVTG
ncbi:MAG: FAD-dependent oxidoreductase [Acidobacteriota bacterium]